MTPDEPEPPIEPEPDDTGTTSAFPLEDNGITEGVPVETDAGGTVPTAAPNADSRQGADAEEPIAPEPDERA